MRALVVFHDNGIGWFSPILRRGFRHCAVMIDDGEYWIGFDSGDGTPAVKVIADSDYDLVAAHYRLKPGYTVLEVTLERRPLSNGPGLHTCVTAIKRLLCIRAWWVQTPYGLYQYLARQP